MNYLLRGGLGLNFMAIVMLCNAQVDIDSSLIIEEVIIASNRIALPIDEYARNLDMITHEEINASPVNSISELLQYHGAIDVRRRGVNGVQSDVSIRGGSFNQVLVMIDGVAMTDPQTGHHVMNLPLSLMDVERVEIIKGPAARMFGPNALSGAINIITKKTLKGIQNYQLGVRYGSFNSLDLDAHVSIPSDYYDQSISLSRSTSDGYKYNTDYNIHNANYRSVIKLDSKSQINISSGISQRKFGANGFYANEKYKEQYEETTTGYISVNTKFAFNNLVLKPVLSWRNNNDYYLFLRDDPSFYKNEHTSNTYKGELHGDYESSIGISGVGLEISNETLESNNLGNRNRNVFGFYLEHRFELFKDKLNITLGTYAQKITENKLNVSPGVDMSYKFDKNWSVFTSFASGTRLPTYTNLYYSSRVEQGNEHLHPERSRSYELGFKYHNNKVQSTLSGFSRNSFDLIDWAKDSIEQEKWYALNINQVTSLGLDWTSTVNLSSLLNSRNDVKITADYTYISAEIKADNSKQISRYALDNLKQQLILGVQYELIRERLDLNIQYRYLDRVSLENYSLMDVKFRSKWNSFIIDVSVNNLWNKTYRETNLVTMPGRWYSVGLRYNLRK